MTNISRQPGEQHRGSELRGLMYPRKMVVDNGTDNSLYAAQMTRPDVVAQVLNEYEASKQAPQPREVAPAAASVVLDATVATEPMPTAPDILHEQVTPDAVETEAYLSSMETMGQQVDQVYEESIGAQVDQAFGEAGISTLEDARAQVNAVFDRLAGEGHAPYAAQED